MEAATFCMFIHAQPGLTTSNCVPVADCNLKHLSQMKILILSDLHLELGPFSSINLCPDVDVVVLAGDIKESATQAVQWARNEPAFKHAKAIIFVPGVLEHWSSFPRDAVAEMRQAAAGSNVHILDSSELVVLGVRFLGLTLWSNCELPVETSVGPLSNPQLSMHVERAMMADFFQTVSTLPHFVDETGDGKPMPTPEQSLWLHRASTSWLSQKLSEPFAGKTVVVSHHAPHRNCVDGYFSDDWTTPAAVTDLPEAYFDVPSLWIHGHVCGGVEHRVKNCRVIANPRGYARGRRLFIKNLSFDSSRTVLL